MSSKVLPVSGSSAELKRYSVLGITGGTDAQGEVSCMLHEDGVSISGKGSHTDILMASALAFVDALNRLEYRKRYRHVRAEEGP